MAKHQWGLGHVPIVQKKIALPADGEPAEVNVGDLLMGNDKETGQAYQIAVTSIRGFYWCADGGGTLIVRGHCKDLPAKSPL